MALGRHGEGHRYISVANGHLHSKVNGKQEDFDWYEGRLVGIGLVEDEWEGVPVAKVELTMEDADGRVKIKFGQETWYSYGFFARLPSVDVTRPFRIGAMPSEQNERMTFCYIRQGDQKIVADKETTPRPEKRRMGKKEVVDWGSFNDHIENVVLETALRLGAAATSDVGAVLADDGPVYTDADLADEDLPF